jgi:BirA family transcriptional regulator, biotin operon repressor / biotin---[acetyl-CoA-carboxylase] ligase
VLSSILTMDGRLLANNPRWLHWLVQTPSTNSWAIAHAHELQHGDVVFTQQQTAGRGQGDRVWYSPPGVLTASFVLDGVAHHYWPTLSLASGLAVIYAIEDLLPDCRTLLQLKWPNDVCYQQRKLAGILAEGQGQRVVVGIGCNRQVDVSGWDTSINPISLHQIQPIVPSELLMLERLRHYLLELAGMLTATSHSGFAPLLPELRRRDGLFGQEVSIDLSPSNPEQHWSGTGLGIDEQGRYQIQNGDGVVRSFAAGRIKLAAAEIT